MILEIRVEMEGLGEDGKKKLRDMGEVKSDKISLRGNLSVCGRIYSSKTFQTSLFLVTSLTSFSLVPELIDYLIIFLWLFLPHPSPIMYHSSH